MGSNLRNKYAPTSERGGDWRDDAACLTEDPELFFPAGKTGPSAEQIQKAKAVCARCLSKIACLEYAMETNQQGVWGETTDDERRAIKRRAIRERRMGNGAIESS